MSADPVVRANRWRQVAEAIAADPTASDHEIARRLHVARATIAAVRRGDPPTPRRNRKARPDDPRERIRAYITTHPHATPQEIAAALNVSVVSAGRIRGGMVRNRTAPWIPKATPAPASKTSPSRSTPPRPERPASPPRARRERWEVESEMLITRIAHETDWLKRQELRLQLLRARWVPHSKKAKAR